MGNNILLLACLHWKHNPKSIFQNRERESGGRNKVKLKFSKLYLRFLYAENLFAGTPESGLQSARVPRSTLYATELDHEHN